MIESRSGSAGLIGTEVALRMHSSDGQYGRLSWYSDACVPVSSMCAHFTLVSLGRHRGDDAAPQPFESDFFRPLAGNEPDAAGSACESIGKGRQIGGFALIATSARRVGRMSFSVNHDGVAIS